MLTDGKQIAAARQLLGWSQADLATRSGVSKPSIIRIEKNLMSVKHDIQKQIQKLIEQNNIEFLDQCGLRENKKTLIQYSGQAGFREFYDDLYVTARDVGGDICLFNGVSDLVLKWLGEDFLKKHVERMLPIQDQYKYRVIVQEKDKSFLGASYCEYKWFPKNLFNDKTIFIYGDKISFITFLKNDIEILVLNQKELAESQKLFFNLAWDYVAMEPVDE